MRVLLSLLFFETQCCSAFLLLVGPHRALHLCAFQIGLYALGLHNRVSPNWLSRTYSSHVSWISGQALEIGRVGLRLLIDTWENHLTPTEVANLADKASQGRDSGIVQAAAELALSALPHVCLNNADVYIYLFIWCTFCIGYCSVV